MSGEPQNTETEMPVWLLTPKEEKQVFLNWRDSAWKFCDEYVTAFEKCEQTAGMGVWFKCRKETKAMRNCIEGRRQKKYVDEERDKFIREKMAQHPEKYQTASREDEVAKLKKDNEYTEAARASQLAPQEAQAAKK